VFADINSMNLNTLEPSAIADAGLVPSLRRSAWRGNRC